MKANDWDRYFFAIAEVVKTKSKDPHTKFGCVIVDEDHSIRTTGYNSLPRGINDNVSKRYVRPEKYLWFEHAERNAIYNAARIGVSLKGSTLYLPVPPCVDCGRAIIQSGIKVVKYDKTSWNEYFKKQDKSKNNSWVFSINKSLKMLREAGVKVIAVEI